MDNPRLTFDGPRSNASRDPSLEHATYICTWNNGVNDSINYIDIFFDPHAPAGVSPYLNTNDSAPTPIMRWKYSTYRTEIKEVIDQHEAHLRRMNECEWFVAIMEDKP